MGKVCSSKIDDSADGWAILLKYWRVACMNHRTPTELWPPVHCFIDWQSSQTCLKVSPLRSPAMALAVLGLLAGILPDLLEGSGEAGSSSSSTCAGNETIRMDWEAYHSLETMYHYLNRMGSNDNNSKLRRALYCKDCCSFILFREV